MPIRRASRLAAIAAGLALIAAAPLPASELTGVWRNPYDTLEVRIDACGTDTCGWVVWAAVEAVADARDDGDDALLGQQLLHGFRSAGAGAWRGGITIPGHTTLIGATLTLLDRGRLQVRGCLLAQFLCHSQTWRHVRS